MKFLQFFLAFFLLLFVNQTLNAQTKHVFNPIIETKFLKPKLGDSAGVFGAALL